MRRRDLRRCGTMPPLWAIHHGRGPCFAKIVVGDCGRGNLPDDRSLVADWRVLNAVDRQKSSLPAALQIFFRAAFRPAITAAGDSPVAGCSTSTCVFPEVFDAQVESTILHCSDTLGCNAHRTAIVNCATQ